MWWAVRVLNCISIHLPTASEMLLTCLNPTCISETRPIVFAACTWAPLARLFYVDTHTHTPKGGQLIANLLEQLISEAGAGGEGSWCDYDCTRERWFLVPTPKHSSNTRHLIELHVELLEEPPACVNLISLCVTRLQIKHQQKHDEINTWNLHKFLGRIPCLMSFWPEVR